MDRLGPRVDGRLVHSGFLLPWVWAQNGNRLFVELIHKLEPPRLHAPPG